MMLRSNHNVRIFGRARYAMNVPMHCYRMYALMPLYGNGYMPHSPSMDSSKHCVNTRVVKHVYRIYIVTHRRSKDVLTCVFMMCVLTAVYTDRYYHTSVIVRFC